MGTTIKSPCCSTGRLFCCLSILFFLGTPHDLWAVDPAKKGQDVDASQRPARETTLQGVRGRDQGARDRHADLSPEGAPALRLRTRPQQWMLGVRVAYLDTGARVTHVFPGTPAWRVGLEPRDVIVSIDGYQIGYVNRQFYEISTELNYRAGRTGWVRLLVQNCRNDQLVNIDVQLARIGVGFPRERFDLPPGARLDQADEPAGDRDDEPNRKPRVAR